MVQADRLEQVHFSTVSRTTRSIDGMTLMRSVIHGMRTSVAGKFAPRCCSGDAESTYQDSSRIEDEVLGMGVRPQALDCPKVGPSCLPRKKCASIFVPSFAQEMSPHYPVLVTTLFICLLTIMSTPSAPRQAGTAEGMAAGVEQTTGVGQKADTDRVKGGESKAAVNDSGGLTQEADVDGGGWEGEMEVSNTVNCSLVHNQPNDDEGEEKSAEMQGDDVNGVLDEEGRGGARVATDNEGCCEHEDAAVNDDSAEADRAKVWMRQAEELFSWIAETERTEIQSSPGLAGKLASIGTKLSVAQQLISTAPTKTVLDERPHRASCFPSRPKFQVVASAPNVVENLQRSASELMEAGQRCLTSLRPYLEVFEGETNVSTLCWNACCVCGGGATDAYKGWHEVTVNHICVETVMFWLARSGHC